MKIESMEDFLDKHRHWSAEEWRTACIGAISQVDWMRCRMLEMERELREAREAIERLVGAGIASDYGRRSDDEEN
jgi:hypothetical protein